MVYASAPAERGVTLLCRDDTLPATCYASLMAYATPVLPFSSLCYAADTDAISLMTAICRADYFTPRLPILSFHDMLMLMPMLLIFR